MRAAALILVGLLLSIFVRAHVVRVGIFSTTPSTSMSFIAAGSDYTLFSGSQKLITLSRDESVKAEVKGALISLKKNGISIGNYKKIRFVPSGTENFFRLKSNKPVSDALPYQDLLELSFEKGKLRAVNVIDLEKYVASVVESETGDNQMEEFLKVQAIIARTFVLGHLDRHASEGFSVCDKVHCQAYRSRNRFNPSIQHAVDSTRNQVLCDAQNQLILAAYHSNCGGQTSTARDAWSQNLSYLQAVNDSFCLNSQHALWMKKISRTSWDLYLRKKGAIAGDSAKYDSLYCFIQNDRVCCLSSEAKSLPLKTIRSDWKLRSTYFSLDSQRDSVTFIGRGYGHGVGLCQEGAMEMARRGYSYREILAFYFRSIRLKDADAIAIVHD